MIPGTVLPEQQAEAEQLSATISQSLSNGTLKPRTILVLVVGTRGDVQGFVGIGLKLKSYGHRVRLATHECFREFVSECGLEFYPLGGDPQTLVKILVKHRGYFPGLNFKSALEERRQVKAFLFSSWGACTQPDPETPEMPFLAQAIVASPPAYGHIHVAEKLNIPCHLVFHTPWTPTKTQANSFAPFRINQQCLPALRRPSYFFMEDIAWIIMADYHKDFRQRVLGLKGWNKHTAQHAIHHCQVPFTYIWSPTLVPRPDDWPPHCEVVGFVSLKLTQLTAYKPPADVKSFLDAGPVPVYIGLGSMVVEDPVRLTEQFLAALTRTGLRAIIQRGWGGLGAGFGPQPDGKPGKPVPPNVLFINDTPHDWLFQHVCAVVNHGGGSIVAAALRAGKPVFMIPFFGDQFVWGAPCHKAGAGPAPVPIDDLTTDKIVTALSQLVTPECQTAAERLAKHLCSEDGASGAVDHIHRTFYGPELSRDVAKWTDPAREGAKPAITPAEIEQVTVRAAQDPVRSVLWRVGFFLWVGYWMLRSALLLAVMFGGQVVFWLTKPLC